MADQNEQIKIPLIEPASGSRKGQVEEFLEYHGGSGVHRPLTGERRSPLLMYLIQLQGAVVSSAEALRKRGADRLEVPSGYYLRLFKVLDMANIELQEDLDTLAKYDIMIDFDEKGYLLQMFTKPMTDRPTAFSSSFKERLSMALGQITSVQFLRRLNRSNNGVVIC